mmetsp:Transcript_65143/g.173698  ORF Transcript_65143/g.173698 Transcript_65143/m.173698 type:complete len:217 (+) Transcript_65143:500-1150(+)
MVVGVKVPTRDDLRISVPSSKSIGGRGRVVRVSRGNGLYEGAVSIHLDRERSLCVQVVVDKHKLPWALILLIVEIVDEVLDPGFHHTSARDHSHASNLWDRALPMRVRELVFVKDHGLRATTEATACRFPLRHAGPVEVAGGSAFWRASQSRACNRLRRIVLLGKLRACCVAPPAGVPAQLTCKRMRLVGESLLPHVLGLLQLVQALVELHHLARA